MNTTNIFESSYLKLAIKTDRLFAGLLFFQWMISILFAFIFSPRSWNGSESSTHLHIYYAVFFGGIITALPLYLVWKKPGSVLTRCVIAVAQMAFSSLLIHLTQGRIETHFHIFGSLAFLAFYRDYRPVILATLITAIDHVVRGAFMPLSIYGVDSASIYRALEHAGWVLFEDFFLFIAIKNGLEELKTISERQLEVEETLEKVEHLVLERTHELSESQKVITEQQAALISTAKMSALGEMAGGVAHEINTPLAVISMKIGQLEECISEKDYSEQDVLDTIKVVSKTAERISKIVSGLKYFSRDGKKVDFEVIKVKTIIDDTLSFCSERFKNNGIKLILDENDKFYKEGSIECRGIELSQVLLNLLNNAFDAIQDLKEKWIEIKVTAHQEDIVIEIIDSGMGIPEEIKEKLMQPFFTTKEIGKGTGLGLSISKGIIHSHGGVLQINSDSKNTCFLIKMPRFQTQNFSTESLSESKKSA